MIEELKEHIYGYDDNGKPAVAGPPQLEEVIEKVNEIIRYLNDKDNRLAEADKTLEEEAQSWAGSSAVDAFIAGAEWQKEQDATQRK